MNSSRRPSVLACLRDDLARHRGLAIAVGLLVLSMLLLVATGQGLGEASLPAVVSLSVLVIALLLGVIAALSLGLAGIDPHADDLAAQLTTDPLSKRLLERWLHRVRWRRWVAGFIGLVIGLFVSSNVGEDLESAAFLYPPLAGVCLASVSAELYLLRRRRSDARTADLSTRDFADYANSRDQMAMAATSVIAALVVGWSVQSDALTDRPWVTTWSLVALFGVALAHLMQRQVVGRSRPAVSAELREADDLLRSLAVSRCIARPAISFACATIGLALAPTTLDGLEAAAWLCGLGCWWFNRGLGIERFLSSQQHTPGSSQGAALS